MSVAVSNCGEAGWPTDRAGYRYDRIGPGTGQSVAGHAEVLPRAGNGAAADTGYPGCVRDACLINRDAPDTRLMLHQDRDQRDYAAPDHLCRWVCDDPSCSGAQQ